MSTQDLENRIVYTLFQRVRPTRSTFVFALSITLWLMASITLVTSDRSSSYSAPLSTSHLVSIPVIHHMPDPPITPTPRTSRSPTAPRAPLPASLWQAIAFLQAQDLFLYHGNSYLPEIALTFDDGPNPYYTPQVLSVLHRYGVKATFFCVGYLVAAYPDLVRQEHAAGHIVGNHSWSHPNLKFFSPSAILSQLNRTSDAIQKAIGVRPTFFRPPYGAFNREVLTQAYRLGLTTVMWNADPQDWSIPGTNAIIARVLYQTGYGTIIVMHDGGGNRFQTVAALSVIIPTLQQRGFRFVTLARLINDLHAKDVPDHPSSSVTTTRASLLLMAQRRKVVMWYTATGI